MGRHFEYCIGMYFFEGNVSSASYISYRNVPRSRVSRTQRQTSLQCAIWQQDGAPSHFGILIGKLFCMKWNEWISCHRGRIKWLPRLNPMWFFTVDIMKEILYSSKPQNLQMHLTSSMKINLCCWKFVIWFKPCVEYMDN